MARSITASKDPERQHLHGLESSQPPRLQSFPFEFQAPGLAGEIAGGLQQGAATMPQFFDQILQERPVFFDLRFQFREKGFIPRILRGIGEGLYEIHRTGGAREVIVEVALQVRVHRELGVIG